MDRTSNIVNAYVLHWNERNIPELKKLFNSSVMLRDWEGSYHGVNAVIAANEAIFESYPKINIKIKQFYFGENKIAAELVIDLDGKMALSVIDVIEIENSEIVKITAYKC